MLNYSKAEGKYVMTMLIGWQHHKKVHSLAGDRNNIQNVNLTLLRIL